MAVGGGAGSEQVLVVSFMMYVWWWPTVVFELLDWIIKRCEIVTKYTKAIHRR
jgi:hypothetical protein